MYGLESAYSEAELIRSERFKLKDLLAVEGILITRERGVLFYIVIRVGIELIIAVRFDSSKIYYAKLTHILLDWDTSRSCTKSTFIYHQPSPEFVTVYLFVTAVRLFGY